jgi:rubrerythrin
MKQDIHVCPICGKTYEGRGALSRKDNQTYICSACGTREAMVEAGLDIELQDEIMQVISDYTESKNKK